MDILKGVEKPQQNENLIFLKSTIQCSYVWIILIGYVITKVKVKLKSYCFSHKGIVLQLQ